MRTATFHQVDEDRADEFVRKGYRRRHVFAHRLYRLPKCGPDAMKLATWMRDTRDPNRLWELVLFAAPSLIEQFPRDLFFDDDVVWHQQQLGRAGQVASANLVIEGPDLYTAVHISDLVQRISRRREHKTQIENRFAGWNHMLLNGILDFALARGVERVHVPTAALALRNTDPARTVGPELFERVYDRNVRDLFAPVRSGDWWRIEVADVRDRVVVATIATEVLPSERVICLCHDVEAGYGHLEADPAFAEHAHATSRRSLEQMLAIEAEAGCVATYNVLGLLLEDVRADIESGGHCLAFHSFDHEVPAARRALANALYRLHDRWRGAEVADHEPGASRQLNKCRELDYRLKGYRPPQSRITADLSDANLCFHNFEWLANSSYALRFSDPRLQNRLVKIPILIDDFDLHRRALGYDAWEAEVLTALGQHQVAAVCLHDCYAPLWLPRYRGFLERLRELGRLVTMDSVASDVVLAHAT
jgi:hypothetical protein